MSEPTIAFTCAYWDWLRGFDTFEPVPEQFGLKDVDGKVLREQCNIEFKHNKQKGTV
jgi:hypothetical protein